MPSRALWRASGPAAACTAIEAALDAIPPAWLKLRHLLSQTYFMPFSLACLASLSRAASLLARVHGSLGAKSDARRRVRLLELAPSPQQPEAVQDLRLR